MKYDKEQTVTDWRLPGGPHIQHQISRPSMPALFRMDRSVLAGALDDKIKIHKWPDATLKEVMEFQLRVYEYMLRIHRASQK